MSEEKKDKTPVDKTSHLGLVHEDGTQTKKMPLPILEKNDVLQLKLNNLAISDAKKGVDLANQAVKDANAHFVACNNTNIAFIDAMNVKYKALGFKAFDLRFVTVDGDSGECAFNPAKSAELAVALKAQQDQQEKSPPEKGK